MATATKPSKTQLIVWDLAVGEVPVRRDGYMRTVYVQRVGDELRFYNASVSDTDAARTGTAAEFVVTARVFTAVVQRMTEAKPGNDRFWEPTTRTSKTAQTSSRRGWSFERERGGVCTFRARCGEAYTVKLAVMQQIVEEFGS